MNLVAAARKRISVVHGAAFDLDGLGHGLVLTFISTAGSRSLTHAFLYFGLERLARRFEVKVGGVEPRVRSQLLDGGASVTLVREEAQDKLLKILAERQTVHLREVEFVLLRNQQIVEVLLGASFLKGENTLHQDKQNHPEREQVCLRPAVDAALLNFRRHVGHGAAVAPEAVILFPAGEPEVCNFKV